MYINLIIYRTLEDVIDRCASAERDSYGNKLSWPCVYKLSAYIRLYHNRNKFSCNAEEVYHNDLYRHLFYNYAETLNNEIVYGEIFNKYHTISNILEGSYGIEDNEVIYDYNYDEYF